MSDTSEQFWPIAGKILLSVCHLFMAVVSGMIGAGLAHEAIQFHDYHPDLLAASLTGVLSLYALATTLSIWNDVLWISRGFGGVIVGGGAWFFFASASMLDASLDYYLSDFSPVIGFVISAGLILTGLSMIWWNERHATIYCRRRMHLGGVILNVLAACGILWVVATYKPRGHMDLGGIVYGLFLGVQFVWLVVLIVATILFPRPPRVGNETSQCYRP
ncbi:MAG TPA: hypothetical protein VMM56_04930 [Planctomycetaceae bacterium]|nr:hypothetical protein [Planctomycetaceae bacterium]